jgi:WD40 repeat protein
MAIFEEALEVRGNDREWFLSVRCADDTAMRAEVEAMLRSSELAQQQIATGAGLSPALAAGDAVQNAPQTPRHFAPVAVLQGHYRIIRALGEGGMGVVYEAEQTIPRRPVAIKAIRSGLTSRQILSRFEREAHILGRLQHPGIAQIFEAGAATADQADEAYFVMEFVDGCPITDFATNKALSVPERLELLAKVCDAVHHAHQRRVIHRDLKPGNILVTKEGQPKILDFGVARLDGSESLDTHTITRHTVAGQLIGTLSYMAPEQLLGQEVDIRSDVYSLGVVLYQVLVNRLPHELTGKSLPEAALIISEEEPPRVSVFQQQLRGDIEVIVQHAMERDRDRRYQSAAELAADIRRHLRGEPILARGDSAMYVLRKQIARYRTIAIGIGLALLALTGFAIYAAVQSSIQAEGRKRVEQLYKEAQEQGQRADANAEHYRAELATNNIERGRLLGVTGNFPLAEQMIWKEHLAAPSDLSHWALWELYSRMPVRASLMGHKEVVTAVAASPDGTLGATAGDSTIRLWDTGDWSCRKVIDTHAGQNRGLHFTADSRFLVNATVDGLLETWDPKSGEIVQKVTTKEPLYSMVVAATGLAPWPVAVRTAAGIRLYTLDDQGAFQEGLLLTSENPPAGADWSPVAINPERSLVAAGYNDGSVRAWNAASGEQVWSASEHGAIVTSLGFSPDGSQLVTGAFDRVILFWDVAGPNIKPSNAHMYKWDNGSVRSLIFSRDGKTILSSGYWRVDVIDAMEHTRAKGFARFEESSRGAVWLPGEKYILAGALGTAARVWEARPSGELRRIAAHKEAVAGMAISPKGDMIASSANDGSIRLWRWPEMEPLGDLSGHTGRVRVVNFSHDGHRLVSGSADRSIRIWDLATHECLLTIPNGGYEYYAAAFSPDDRSIVTGVRDMVARIYDTKTGELTNTLSGTVLGDGTLAASYDAAGRIIWLHGRVLASWDNGKMTEIKSEAGGWTMTPLSSSEVAVGCWGGLIQIMNLDKGAQVQTLTGHTQVVTSVALGPQLSDGARGLVSCSAEGLIKLWSTKSGMCLLTLNPEAGQVLRMVTTPDGRWVISGHEDGTLGVWDLSYFDAHIRAAAPRHAPTKTPG